MLNSHTHSTTVYGYCVRYREIEILGRRKERRREVRGKEEGRERGREGEREGGR